MFTCGRYDGDYSIRWTNTDVQIEDLSTHACNHLIHVTQNYEIKLSKIWEETCCSSYPTDSGDMNLSSALIYKIITWTHEHKPSLLLNMLAGFGFVMVWHLASIEASQIWLTKMCPSAPTVCGSLMLPTDRSHVSDHPQAQRGLLFVSTYVGYD